MIKNFKYKSKNYAHFDKKTCVKDAKNYIENPQKIATHSFYPFIHFTKKWIKYSYDDGRNKKPRELYYAAHMDSYIYQLYGCKLNDLYNKKVKDIGINNCATAYRNNMHKSNIEFAYEVFKHIRKTSNALVIVGDFTHFFDRIDHQYLKERLCELLGTERLPEDYYAIYRNITKYSKMELDDLLKLNGDITYKELNKKETVLPIDEFRKNKKQYLHSNRESYGIPQGASISAVLSNVFMIEFDRQINNYVTTKKGMYRRYSDDFIIILPWIDNTELKNVWSFLETCVGQVDNLKLQPKKTKVFHYTGDKILSCNTLVFPEMENSKDVLEYLGFAFDGRHVYLRDKTVSKYYYRMNRKVDNILAGEYYTGKKVSRYKLYKKYSHLGSVSKKIKDGNFLTYVNRCENVFGKHEKVNIVKKRHWGKMHNRLNRKVSGKSTHSI